MAGPGGGRRGGRWLRSASTNLAWATPGPEFKSGSHNPSRAASAAGDVTHPDVVPRDAPDDAANHGDCHHRTGDPARNRSHDGARGNRADDLSHDSAGNHRADDRGHHRADDFLHFSTGNHRADNRGHHRTNNLTRNPAGHLRTNNRSRPGFLRTGPRNRCRGAARATAAAGFHRPRQTPRPRAASGIRPPGQFPPARNNDLGHHRPFRPGGHRRPDRPRPGTARNPARPISRRAAGRVRPPWAKWDAG
jgi:hypothetical protein